MTTQDPQSRRLYVSMIVSLDGYIEDAQKSLDWFHDGDPAFERYCDEMIDSVGLALYGRRSYQLMESYWPNAELNPRSPADGAFAVKMNALPKVVLSTTLKEPQWWNTRVISCDVAAQIRALKREPGKPIVAWAGAGLVRTLMEHDLADEYRLIVHPTVLGSGTPLFQGVARRKDLTLVRTTQLGPQLVVLCYEPKRA